MLETLLGSQKGGALKWLREIDWVGRTNQAVAVTQDGKQRNTVFDGETIETWRPYFESHPELEAYWWHRAHTTDPNS